MEPPIVVNVLCDDAPTRITLEQQLRLRGFSVRTYASVEECEHAGAFTSCGCLLIRSESPALVGFQVLERLQMAATTLGVVLISGRVDVRAAVHAMRLGALDVLPAPYSEVALLHAIDRAVTTSTALWAHRAEWLTSCQRLDSLTRREREVGQLVVNGLVNREIASILGTSIKTVKVHRGRVMKKLDVTSLADLVRVFDRARHLPPSLEPIADV